jgi:hypothetical protein
MIRIAILALATLVAADRPARSGEPIALKASGSGLFSPANIGVTGQPGAGVVLGDGTGLSAYRAFGWDFSLDGIQLGPNLHLGANQSYSTGIPQANGNLAWPVESAANPYVLNHPSKHVMVTVLGEIHMTYGTATSRYELDPIAGVIHGYGDFKVVGGTGRFRKATGLIKVVVTSNLAEDLTQDGVLFDYDFEGTIKLR